MSNLRFFGLKNFLKPVLIAFLLIGCSSKSFVGQSQWAQNEIKDIKVDGFVRDWPQLPPLYYDESNRMTVQMMNNDKALYIYLSVAGEGLKKGIVRNGMSLTFEPVGSSVSPLKIVSKDHQPIEVFYPSESYPVVRSIAETGEKEIEVKMAPPDGSAMVFEAKIGFGAIYPPAGILPGTKLILKIESTKMEISEKFSSGESRGKPGGGGGHGRGGGGKGMKSPEKREKAMEPFETTLELILAADPL